MESDREAWWNLLLVQELLIPTYTLAIVTHAMLFRFVASSTGSIECPGAYAMCRVIIRFAIETINLQYKQLSTFL